jgi:predicted Zn-dependent protease
MFKLFSPEPMRKNLTAALAASAVLLVLVAATPGARAQKGRGATGALKVETGKAGSVVFINNVRHGATGEAGTLELARVKAGSYPVRVRSVGYVDWTGSVIIAAGSSRVLKVTQRPTADEATLHYQRGDELRDRAKNRDAVKEYEQALRLRPAFAAARVAMARSLISLQDFQEAEKQLRAAMKDHGRPLAEAQTVMANLRRQQGLVEESIEEYRKALRLARGVSPEAHIGLAIALNESGQVDESIKEYRIGIDQDMDTEPILYYQLGNILEKEKRNKEAIEAYRNYLRLDPEGELASAVESMIKILEEETDNR